MAGSDVTLGGAGSEADLAYTPHVSSLVISTMAIVCLELVIPLTVLQVYDRVVPNEGTSTLPVLVTGAAFFLLLDMILRAARAHIIGMNGAISGHRIARRAMEKIVISDVQSASSRKVAENLSILGSVRSLKYSYDGQTLVTLIELGFGPLALLLIAIVAGPLVAVPVIAIALFSLVTLINGRKLVDCIDKRAETDDRRFDYLIDILKAAQSVKSLAMEGRIIRRYEHFKYRSCVDNFQFSQSVTMIFDTAAGFATFLTLCMIIFGSYMVVQGWITTGAMIASMILAGRTILPLQRGLSLYVRSQAIRLERRNAQSFLQDSYVDRIVDEATDNPEVGNDGALRLENVTVDDDSQCSLAGANVDLKPFEYYVLDGFSREQSTAFFRLCAGLSRPQEGRILLNSHEMESLSDATRSRCLAYLQSRAVIYRGTVMENLSRFGVTSLADVLYVSRLINLEAEISGLPQGLDTHLRGDMSDPLDPGLKQRIALVRQLAPRPRMILFDNADMGLDRRTYTAVYDLLARLSGKATIIMSTGDANLRNLATRKLEIVDGKLIDSEVSSEFNLTVTKYRELRI